ncbi:MAG: HAD family hydrolase, partial [Rhodospirillaceae bacterium]|nr:HAD family hydrolase [Rhodospirillaceae bacterium]
MSENPLAPPRGAAFLDRDGVLNVDSGFAHRPGQITWVEGAFDAVRRLNQHGLYVFVVTNQSGVARGLYTETDVRGLHAWMAEHFQAQGARIDDFAYCPHHPEAAVAAYKTQCLCRKPAPGLLLNLMEKWPVDAGSSFLIGDRDTDLEAARAAGVPGHLFSGGNLDDKIRAI